MKIEIYFLNTKLTTEIKKDIQVKDLLNDLKEYFDAKDSNFILFDNNHRELKEYDTISIKKGNQITFYLNKSSINKNNLINSEKQDKSIEKLSKEQLIMHCTGAKKPIDVKKFVQANQNNRFSILELFDNNRNNENGPENNAFDRLLNIIQVLEENNQILFRPGPINNNTQIEADEHALRELQDMGFPEDRARQALINSRNDINRATELLLGEGE
jgi:hypothetical protein